MKRIIYFSVSLFLITSSYAQERSNTLIKALEATNADEYKKRKEELAIIQKGKMKEIVRPIDTKTSNSNIVDDFSNQVQNSIIKDTLKSIAKGVEKEIIKEHTQKEDSTKKAAIAKGKKETKRKISIKDSSVETIKTLTDNIPVPNPQYSDVNGAYKAELAAKNAAIEAANARARNLENSVAYYKKLREKYENDERIRIEKEEKLKEERAKKEQEAFNNRHLKEEDAPQFDKFRNGAKNPEVKKTSAEEDYSKLFK